MVFFSLAVKPSWWRYWRLTGVMRIFRYLNYVCTDDFGYFLKKKKNYNMQPFAYPTVLEPRLAVVEIIICESRVSARIQRFNRIDCQNTNIWILYIDVGDNIRMRTDPNYKYYTYTVADSLLIKFCTMTAASQMW